MKRIRMAFMAASFMAALTAAAQPISTPWQCGFEDAAENSNWRLNVGTDGVNCTDQWFIGTSTFSEGRSSLYITDDNGINPYFGREPNVVVASRTFSVQSSEGYEVSFDWKNKAETGGGMYVCLTRASSANQPESDATSAVLPSWFTSAQQRVTLQDGTTTYCMAQSQEWTTASFKIPSIIAGQDYILSFVWVNANKDSIFDPVGACVDNIQIVTSRCDKPTGLNMEQISCDSVMLQWTGAGPTAEYAVEYRAYGEDKWIRREGIETEQYLITGMKEGTYDFRVQTVCSDGSQSSWASLYSQLVFCKENHCINFVDLTDPNITCYTGYADDEWSFVPNRMDDGPDAITSRHTVYWTQNQYDPRTEYRLKTIPDGELASVRLGNWNTHGEAERIEIKYHVDCTSASILILKYAIVLEDPSHEEEDQPYFSLKLLDPAGTELNPTCGSTDFYADTSRAGWYTNLSVENQYITSTRPIYVCWKDWTSMGIDLTPYDGMDIVIRLETRDCTLNAHYGYAYFTLSCASGDIENVGCGANPLTKIKAPDGFDYRWYASDDPTKTLSEEQTYDVPSSNKRLYYVDCMFKENHDCKFTLQTTVSPRDPFADFTWTWEPGGCKNRVRLINKSQVVSQDDEGNTVYTGEECDEVEWDFGGEIRKENDPVVDMPAEGGKLTFSMTSYIAERECWDDTTCTIDVPTILPDNGPIDSTVCYGELVQFGDILINTKGIEPYTEYEHTEANFAGCDSTSVLRLTVLPEIEPTYIDTVICYGETLMVGDVPLSESAEGQEVHLENADGCDSVVIVNLTVADEVTFTVTHTDETDAAKSGSISISDAPEGYTYTVNGETGAPLTGLTGGEYVIVVIDSNGCASEPDTVRIERDCLEVDIESTDTLAACSGEESLTLAYTVNKGIATTYAIEYGDRAKAAGFADAEDSLAGDGIKITLPDSCRPDYYDAEIVLHDVVCGEQRIPISFTVYYPADIIRQKWDNVLAVQNSDYNGGYDFTAFQWYKDGAPIGGESGSYLYLGEGNSLDTGGTYQVMLTRADDGVAVLTCPLIPEERTELTAYPTITVTQAGSLLPIAEVKGSVAVKVWSAAGVMYVNGTVDEYNAFVQMPKVPGVYVMQIEKDGVCETHKIVLR